MTFSPAAHYAPTIGVNRPSWQRPFHSEATAIGHQARQVHSPSQDYLVPRGSLLWGASQKMNSYTCRRATLPHLSEPSAAPSQRPNPPLGEGTAIARYNLAGDLTANSIAGPRLRRRAILPLPAGIGIYTSFLSPARNEWGARRGISTRGPPLLGPQNAFFDNQ